MDLEQGLPTPNSVADSVFYSMNLQHKWEPAKDAEPSQAAMLTKLTAQVATLNQKLQARTAASEASTKTQETKGRCPLFCLWQPWVYQKDLSYLQG